MTQQAQSGFLIAAAIAVSSFLPPGSAWAAEPKDAKTEVVPLYHHDRAHLWNRVHAALLIRNGPDGQAYGQDRLEPLLWGESKHLKGGSSEDQAVAVLEEFLRVKGESLVEDPVKRAALQRDLWNVFNGLADTSDLPTQRRLVSLLADVIRRIALSPDQIDKLPDNYAAAVASKVFSDRFDPQRPGIDYLPPNLFQADGNWVCVGRSTGQTAPLHLAESNPFTNSVFLVFLKFPEGRDATMDFLKRLAAFDQPLYVLNTDEKTKRRFPNLPNPALPQWPRGAEVALVRRALLIDSTGRVVASRLTESVQLRVMRTDTPAITGAAVEELSRGLPDTQAFAEFQLRRTALFAGQAGGLRDVSAERDFKTGFGAHPWDDFDNQAKTPAQFLERSRPFASNRASCFGCHQYPGVYGFNSFHGDFPFTVTRTLTKGRDGQYVPKSHSLATVSIEKVEESAVKWKEEQRAWKVLRKLLRD